MIKSMHIENFKCFKNFDIELGPFNVLVGPNDSGKTAFLQAVRLVSTIPPKNHVALFNPQRPGNTDYQWLGTDNEVVWRNDEKKDIRIEVRAASSGNKKDWPCYQLQSKRHTGPRGRHDLIATVVDDGTSLHHSIGDNAGWWEQAIWNSAYYRFNPADLRIPSKLSDPFSGTGTGFPTFLDDIGRSDWERFGALETGFKARFPYYKKIERPVSKDDTIALQFRTVNGEVLSAGAVSDGVMLSLSFLALCYQSDPPRILLIEEPENGVHHASLKEIVETLRSLSRDKGVQVILTTHSPYLLDLVEPEEVRVFAKDDDGAVHAAKLSEHPDVDGLKKHFMTGEIWTEFDEKDIVAGRSASK